jgi:glycosyltransferase involved in cell wall biosynthesis
MRILILTAQVPFVRGGAEVLAETLRDALRAAGHEAEIAAIPWTWYPPERVIEHMMACRLLDVTESMGTPVDRVIGLKFPAYLASHPNKVLWLVHQHRQAYDLWGNAALGDLQHSPSGPEVREAVRKADQQFIPEARAVYTISQNVTRRLKSFNGIDSLPLYPPPRQAEAFSCAAAEPYLFFPSRLSPQKRQALVLEALAHTRRPVRVRFAGTPDLPAYAEDLRALADKLGVAGRVEWLGLISEADKRRHYAHARAVVYPPLDEDYGYVTLEAMLAAKAVVTCADSGGPLEFVVPRQTGLIAEPKAPALAAALDEVWQDQDQARSWGQAGRDLYERLDIGWPQVVRRLTA